VSGAGLEAQRRAIAAECKRRGWQLVETIEDCGYSAKEANTGRDEDREHDRQAGELLAAEAAHEESDPQWHRGQRVTNIVDHIGEQRDRTREHKDRHLPPSSLLETDSQTFTSSSLLLADSPELPSDPAVGTAEADSSIAPVVGPS
jgi:hypothetical protein